MFIPFGRKPSVDPKLAEQLRRRGKTKELRELQDQANMAQTRKHFLPSLKKTWVGAAEKTKFFGTELGGDVGRALLPLTKEGRKLDELLSQEEITPQEYLEITTNGRTAKNVLGDAGKLALTTLSAGRIVFKAPGLTGTLAAGTSKAAIALKGARAAQQFKKAETFAGKIGMRLVKTAKDFSGGALFGGAEAISRNEDPREVFKEAVQLGTFTALLPPALGVVAKGVGKLTGLIGSKILKPLGIKTVESLKKAATPSYLKNLKGAKNISQKTLARTTRNTSFTQKAATVALKAIQSTKELPTKFVDRFFAMNKIDNALVQAGVPDAAVMNMRFRMTIPKADERASFMLDDLFGVTKPADRKIAQEMGLPVLESGSLKQFKPIREHVEARLHILDDIDRVKLNNTTPQGGVIKNAEHKAKVLADLNKELKQQVDFAVDAGIEEKIQTARKIMGEYNDNLLKMRLESGLISEETYNVLQKTHPDYIPHNVVKKIDDEIFDTFYQSGSLNPQSDIYKAVGSKRLIDPAYHATADRTVIAVRNIEKNNTVRGLVEAQEAYGMVPGMKPIQTAERIIARRKYIGQMKALRIELNTYKKDLSSTKKFDRSAQSKINGMIDDLDKTEKKIVDELNDFFQAGTEVTEVSGVQKTIPKIPTKFSTFEAKAKNVSKKEFIKSNTLLKELEEGTLERSGFSSREEFWDVANAGIVETGGTETVKKLKGSLGKIAKLGKEKERLGVATEETIAFTKKSIDDRISFLDKNIKEIGEERSSVYQKILELSKKKTETGAQTVNLYRQGEKETWIVPDDIMAAVKNLDNETMSRTLRFLTVPVRMLKAGATRLNISFAIPNKLRDKQTAMLTADAFIGGIAEKMGRTASELGYSKKELSAILRLSGGSQASIFKEGRASDVLRSLKQFEQSNVKTIAREANPKAVVEKINEGLEASTRLEVLNRALAAGLTKEEATFVSRNATIDFAKMGTWMKQLNQIIPFLNARVQATINLGKSFKMNPEHFMRMQMWSAVYPTMGLHQWNRQFETNKNVPQYIKNNYYYIMTGEEEGVDIDGNPAKIAKYVTIRKGEGQSLISNPLQWFLDKADGTDYRGVDEMLTDTIGSLSPVTFNTFGSSNSWLSMISQFGPLASVSLGLGTNINPYTGTNIIPVSKLKASDKTLQTKMTTPKILVDMTKWLKEISEDKVNLSPAQLDFVQGQFGGMPDDILLTANLLKQVQETGEIDTDSLTDSKTGTAARLPVSKRFVREAGEIFSPESEFREQQLEEIRGDVENVRLMDREKAYDVLEEIDPMESKDKKNFIKDNIKSGTITKGIYDQMVSIHKYKRTIDRLKKSDPVEVRARFIVQRLKEIDSKDARSEYMLLLQDAGLLTKAVAKLMYKLRLDEGL